MISASQLQRANSQGLFVLDDSAHRGSDYTTLCGETLFELADGLMALVEILSTEAPISVRVQSHTFDDYGKIGVSATICDCEKLAIEVYLDPDEDPKHAFAAIFDWCSTASCRKPDEISSEPLWVLGNIEKAIRHEIRKHYSTKLRLQGNAKLTSMFTEKYAKR